MPFSRRQLRWAHTPSGRAALGDSKVAQWDAEVKGVDLPETSSGATEAGLQKRLHPVKGNRGTRVEK